jgi:EmrB/QacA subfamily drug resistance transporter
VSVSGVETVSAPAQAGAPTRGHWWILVIIAAAQLMVVLDTTIMIIALPSAQRSLGFSNADRQWVVTAYTLGFGGLLLLGGRISDMVGPKRTLMVGVIGFAVASALGGAAQNTGMLVGARALQGMFGALLAPSVLSLLTTTFADPRERGRAFGIYASIAIGGAAFGLILGGLLTQYLDWRWCLYVNLPIAAVVALGAFTMIPSRRGFPGVRLDVPGTILGCGGLVALVYALGEAGTDGWGATRVLVSLTLAVVLLSLFVWVQSRVSSPLLPLRIVTNRNRGGSFLTIVLAVLGMYGTFLFLTYLLQTVDHYSPLKAGVAFLPLMVINGLAATQLASRLMPHLRTRLLVVPGLLIAAAGVGLLTQLTPDSSYVSHVLPAELLLGLGLGLAMVPAISTATNHAEPRDAGVTSAATNTSQQVGASIGTALLNTIAATATASYLAVHARGSVTPAQATVHGFAVASAWAAGSLVLAAVIGGVLINAHPGRDVPARAPAERVPAPAESALDAERPGRVVRAPDRRRRAG